MKYSLRSLLLATILLPPLLAKGWRLLDAALTPEFVYPGLHIEKNVSWEDAKGEVVGLKPATEHLHREETP